MADGRARAGVRPSPVRRTRVVVVTTHPIQYQVPLWRALSTHARLEPHVLFLSRHGLERRVDPNFRAAFAWDIDLSSGYQHTFLHNLRETAPAGQFWSHINPALPRCVRRLDPDAILFAGIRNPSAIAGLVASRLHRVPCLYRAESSSLEPHSRSSRTFARTLLGRVQAVAPIGTSNDRYYEKLGIPPDRRFMTPYTVDNDFFRAMQIDRADARAALGIDPDEFVVLFSGKLVAWKNPLDVVSACARLRGDRPVRLLVAGDGVLRAELERRAADAGLAVTLLGFVNQSGLGRVYSASDVLVLPSELEPWGLVVNEAMNFGLPVLVSNRVGAHLDLVRPEQNGLVFTPGDVDTVARGLQRLLDEPRLLAAWGARSRELIASWGIPQTVAGLVGAIEAVTQE